MAEANLLLEPVVYKMEETAFGTWKRFLGATGRPYEEFTSHRRVCGLPLLHYTAGISPETGKRKKARGFIAVGRFAIGFIAIGQVAFGFIAIGQLALGLVFGLGQATTGAFAVGQAAAGGAAAGQMSVGIVAVGQSAAGYYALGGSAAGIHTWTPQRADPEAQRFFRSLVGR